VWLISKALYESLHSSQEQAVESSEESSSGGELSVQLSGNPTQLAYLPPDKMTAFSRLSRFGMTFKPLTEDRGEELLMSYRAGFPAKTSPQQEKEQGLTENEAGCGEKWRGSFVKYDRDSSSWKTHQCSLLGDLEPFLETWPSWGLMRDGECWALTQLERHTEGSGFGWWPTPTATDWMTGKVNGIEYRNRRFIRTSLTSGTEFGANLRDAFRLMTGEALQASFSEWMMGWPLGWTDLKPLETDKSPCVLQKHGEN
jgi:hypothetical protein